MSITQAHRNPIRARITSQGQITVPKRVRDALAVEAGDELEFELAADRADRAIVRPRRRRALGELTGIAASAAGIPTTARALDEAIGMAASRQAKMRTGGPTRR